MSGPQCQKLFCVRERALCGHEGSDPVPSGLRNLHHAAHRAVFHTAMLGAWTSLCRACRNWIDTIAGAAALGRRRLLRIVEAVSIMPLCCAYVRASCVRPSSADGRYALPLSGG